MRGYSNLKKSGKLSSISTIKSELTTCKLDIDERFFSPLIFGAGLPSAELIVRQYLLLRIGGWDLNRAILYSAGKSGGKVVMAMPTQWINVIEKNGFAVNRFASNVTWVCYILAAYLYGFFNICQILVISLTSGCAQARQLALKPYVYFHALDPQNLPLESDGGVSYDIISWYLKWQGKKPNIQAIHHTVQNAKCKKIGDVYLNEQSGYLPPLAGIRERASYLVWSLKAVGRVAIDILCGRYWHALLLNQAALLAKVRIIPPSLLAHEYLFHNSGRPYRPLWTYEVEDRGATISFYFYSTNCEGFKPPEGMTPLGHGWSAMNWPRYLVWDRHQQNFLRRAIGHQANIRVVGPIWFHRGPGKLTVIDKPSVAIFDVSPLRQYLYRNRAFLHDYYTPKIAISFLRDICNAFDNYDVQLLWKRKRKLSSSTHPGYRRFANFQLLSQNITSIDAGVDAYRLCLSSTVTISMPFTSTALIARSLGKPSIYYDPTEELDKGDPGAHGIQIISGVRELENWIKFNF